jgi:hypothetical protein
MGNFSRDTFDPAKRYVAVRLQQGVPLVDADWNELQDVTRNELYDGLGIGVPDAVGRETLTLAGVGNNDLMLSPGTAVLGGRPLRLSAELRYSTQRYANAATAAADGVPVAGPLTTPTANRTDLAYLDVWEREVASTEDPSLVNAAIGVETSVRRRRELALRVAEGSQTLPQPAAGHAHLPLALLVRTAAPAIADSMIEAVQPMAPLQGSRVAAFVPAFPALEMEAGIAPVWQVRQDAGIIFGQAVALPSLYAFKPAGQGARGVLPLTLPAGARLVELRCVGVTGAKLDFGLLRVYQDFPPNQSPWEGLASETVVVPPGTTEVRFNRTVAIRRPAQGADNRIVDNDRFYYAFGAQCLDTGSTTTTIRAISVRYVP